LLSSPLPLRPLARQRTHCQHDATLLSGLCMPVLNLKKILSWLPHCASQDKTPCANALPPPPPPTTHPHLHRRLACEPVGFQSCPPPHYSVCGIRVKEWVCGVVRVHCHFAGRWGLLQAPPYKAQCIPHATSLGNTISTCADC
jgi:hypothetical protein